MIMSEKTAARNITEGVIWKQLLKFFFPILLGAFFQQMYNTVDAVIVGKFVGTFGLSAVSQSSLIVNFATMVCLGFSNAGQVLIARDVGSQNMNQVQKTIGTMFTFLLSISLIISFGCFFIRENILRFCDQRYHGRVAL